MKKLSELIPEGIRTCAITGHVNPDGDCVGSVTAVYQYIRKYRPEIDVTLSFPGWRGSCRKLR